MQVNITIKGLEGDGKSDSIKNYVSESFVKIAEFLDREEWSPVNVDIVAKVAAVHVHHEVECHIRAPHFSVIVKK
jgi:ribosome-associated translation inhibitor RaiA